MPPRKSKASGAGKPRPSDVQGMDSQKLRFDLVSFFTYNDISWRSCSRSRKASIPSWHSRSSRNSTLPKWHETAPPKAPICAPCQLLDALDFAQLETNTGPTGSRNRFDDAPTRRRLALAEPSHHGTAR